MDKLATNELETAPADFGKLSDLVKNEVAKKNIMNQLKKLMLFRLLILAIQIKKTEYNTEINYIEKKINDHDHHKY